MGGIGFESGREMETFGRLRRRLLVRAGRAMRTFPLRAREGNQSYLVEGQIVQLLPAVMGKTGSRAGELVALAKRLPCGMLKVPSASF